MADNADNTNKQPLDELKTSSLDRRLSIAKASLQLGKRWAGNSVSGWFLSKEQRDERKQAFRQEQAQYLADELGKLKGSVVKIGQMLALYGEHFLPDEITHALHSLNDNTATLSWARISETLQAQLGDLYHELEINPTPIGTASLAQVHRATIIETGQDVVLKVQYPGVAEAIDSDLNLFKQLLKVTNAVPQTRALDDWFAEIRDLLHHEVNYHTEADTTERFYQYLLDDNRYVVPQIIRRYSSERLLCMTFEKGVPITDLKLQQLNQQRRNALGQSAIDILFQEIFVWGEMQTDPNFGNYLIRLHDPQETDTDPNTNNGATTDNSNNLPDQIVLLDFGAIRQFDEHLLSIAKGLMQAGYYHDKTAMQSAMTGYDFFDSMSEDIRQDMAEVFLLATEPFSNPTYNPNLTHASQVEGGLEGSLLDNEGRYIWAKSDLHNRVMKQAGGAMQSREFSLPPKEFMFISRKFIGAYTLLTVLDAHTDSKQFAKYFA